MTKNKSLIKKGTVSLFPEAAIGYLLGPVLALLSNGVINIWLVQYWDKVLGLGDWNPLFQTILPIVSAIVIVAGNLIVGRLMERKPSIVGKARPLILLGLPFVAVALLLLFLVPFPNAASEATILANAAAGTKSTEGGLLASILIAVGYNLYYAIAWPIYYTSHSALVNLSTRDGGKRSLLSTCIMAAQLGAAGVSGMFGGILVDLLGLLPVYTYTDSYLAANPVLKESNITKTNAFGDVMNLVQDQDYVVTISRSQANEKWTILMIIMIVCLIAGCLLEFFFTRERITEERVSVETSSNGEKKEAKKVSMSEQVKICVKDKYWWLVIVFFFLYQFGGQMKNNAMSFYSQAMTGGASLSSVINTIGAIPTTIGMAIVWPIAAKIGKTKTISLGGVLAFIGAGLAFLALIPGLNSQNIVTIVGSDLTTSGLLAVVSFIVKAFGTAPAMYIALSVLALVLDHQEAVHGVRTDGFTMAVYGSIMVAMSGVCNGIIVGIKAITPKESMQLVQTILAFGVEGVCYLVMAILFIFLKVEKFTKVDNIAILQDQKEKVLAEGGKWVEPAERARLEEEENDRLVVEASLKQIKLDCEKKGLNYETESKAYLDAHALELKKAADKKAEDERKRAEAEANLSEEKKAKNKAQLEEALAEFNKIRLENNKKVISL